ncbi:MAG: hypothetical protein WAL88_07545 [Nitrosotalea sp.]
MPQEKPFLWDHVMDIESSSVATGGEERVKTASSNEESDSAVIEMHFSTKINPIKSYT